ncbi:MAG: hypothetical protein KBF37_03060 [Saprospiraceae bacterium]|jgi:hypothetical protein|nr:hypothetical protein [Saprospiraceae bacterium]MBP9209280.1 hypothetical protein [Saprospiraceae bacterium]
MKTILNLLLLCSCLGFVSCNEDDEYTLENKSVTGNIDYTLKSFVPLTFDSTGMVPLSAQITMEGVGTITDVGNVTMISTFTFDFITGMGSNLEGTFTGDKAEDVIEVGGFTQQQPNGSFIATETITGGKGKFSKIKGGGTTLVNLVPDRSSGTGVITWKISY